jgi:hypothetical protein
MSRQLPHESFCDIPLGISVEDAHGFILRRERIRTKETVMTEARIVAGHDQRFGEIDSVITNVPHYVCWHSPSGYEWGFGGSGPAELALNIVEHVLRQEEFDGPAWSEAKDHAGSCFAAAVGLHQEFKWAFVSKVPTIGGMLPYEVVKEWVMERVQLLAFS